MSNRRNKYVAEIFWTLKTYVTRIHELQGMDMRYII